MGSAAVFRASAGQNNIFENITDDKKLQRKGCEHIEPETEASNVDPIIVTFEVVQEISLGIVAKVKKTIHGHDQTAYHGDATSNVSEFGKPIDGSIS